MPNVTLLEENYLRVTFFPLNFIVKFFSFRILILNQVFTKFSTRSFHHCAPWVSAHAHGWACCATHMKVRGRPRGLSLTSHLVWDRIFQRLSWFCFSSLQWDSAITYRSVLPRLTLPWRLSEDPNSVPHVCGHIIPTESSSQTLTYRSPWALKITAENNPKLQLMSTWIQTFEL